MSLYWVGVSVWIKEAGRKGDVRERRKGWEGEGQRDTHAKPGRATGAGLRIGFREAGPISAEADGRVSTSLQVST